MLPHKIISCYGCYKRGTRMLVCWPVKVGSECADAEDVLDSLPASLPSGKANKGKQVKRKSGKKQQIAEKNYATAELEITTLQLIQLAETQVQV